MEYKSIELPYEKELAEIEKICHEQIAPLLDKCGLNTCVLRKTRWRNEDDDAIHESWGVHICNAAEEVEVYSEGEE